MALEFCTAVKYNSYGGAFAIQLEDLMMGYVVNRTLEGRHLVFCHLTGHTSPEHVLNLGVIYLGFSCISAISYKAFARGSSGW